MRTVLTLSLLLLGHTALAETPNSATEQGLPRLQSLWEEASDSRNWQAVAGLGIGYAPEIMGGEVYKATALPSFDLSHRSGFFLGSSKGLGWSYAANPDWQAAIFIGMSPGRKEKTKLTDKQTFKGMGEIKAAAQAGLLLSYSLQDLNLSLQATTGLDSKNRGQQITLGADYTVYSSAQFALMINGALTASSSDYQQRWYGVSAAQARKSGFKAYQAGSGLTQGSVGVTAIVPLSNSLRWVNAVSYNQLLGDAADSPLVKEKGSAALMSALQYTW
ncbi:MipA/OmpV family protein [Chitinibacter sp. ZOR0017]|uniref:MipA/OmpV family protein n=1 Tax=Chitinibacter sp. ZOR0017 TaxID=1339254 RepID=UPI000648787E|nr:MipA/OmpV family protein [Chitinibacter sp. ZOR0017]